MLNALTVGQHDAKVELRIFFALLGSALQPREGAQRIDPHAQAFGISDAELALRHRIALRGRLAEPAQRLRVAWLDTLPTLVHQA